MLSLMRRLQASDLLGGFGIFVVFYFRCLCSDTTFAAGGLHQEICLLLWEDNGENWACSIAWQYCMHEYNLVSDSLWIV